MAGKPGARSVLVAVRLTPGEAALLEAVRAVRAWGGVPESQAGLVASLVRAEAERQVERLDLPGPARAVLQEAQRRLQGEAGPDPRRGRPPSLSMAVPVSGGRVPPAVRPEDVRAGCYFEHAELRWPDGRPRRCRVLEADGGRVTWAALRKNGTPLASHWDRREEFPWRVGRWLGRVPPPEESPAPEAQGRSRRGAAAAPPAGRQAEGAPSASRAAKAAP